MFCPSGRASRKVDSSGREATSSKSCFGKKASLENVDFCGHSEWVGMPR